MNWRHRLGIVSLVLAALVAGATWGTQVNYARNPVPLANLGLAEDHAEQSAIAAAQEPKFLIVGSADQNNASKNVRLWDAVIKVLGTHTPNYPQQIGDCTAFGGKNVAEHLQCVQISLDGTGEFHQLFPPFNYGYSRVDIGKGRIRGDGSVGAWVAQSAKEGGMLRSDISQCPKYDGSVATKWGREGPPQWAKDIAKDHTVKTVSLLNSAQDGCDAICNGYPFTIASNFGTSSIKPRDGRNVAKWNATWPHQMAVVGYDGTSASGELYFYVLNSWGPKAHPDPLQGEPPGGFWVTWADMDRIIKQGDSWAFSAFDGFPSADLNFDAFNVQAAGSAAQPQGDPSMFAQVELDPTVFYPIAAVLLVAGIACLIWGNVARWTGRTAAGLAVILIAGAIQAQEISFQAFNAKSTVTGLKTTNEISFAAFGSVAAAAEDNHCPISFGAFHCSCGPECKCIDCTKCDCSPPSAVSVVETIRPEILSVYAPPWCREPCEWLRKHLGDGDEKTKLEWNKREAWFIPKSYPMIVNRRTLKHWCQDPAPNAPDTRPKNMDELRSIFAVKNKQQRMSKGVPE